MAIRNAILKNWGVPAKPLVCISAASDHTLLKLIPNESLDKGFSSCGKICR